MAHSKPLLMPWLRANIDRGGYPGVHWTNPDKTEFCIPWKHGLRQDSSDTDVLIFKAWAEVSGNGHAQGDPSVWKRNFRSALRAKGFTLVSDSKNDPANPHKVYRWPAGSPSGANSTAGSQEQEVFSVLNDFIAQESKVVPFFVDEPYEPQDLLIPECQDILQECLRGLNIAPEAEATAGFQPPAEQQQLQHQVVIGAHPLPGQQRDPVMSEGAACETGLPEQPARPAEGAGYGDGQHAALFLQTMNQTRDGANFKTHFRVTVYYRGAKVLVEEVQNEAGLRIIYRPDLTGTVLDPETGLSLISLPTSEGILDQTQAKLTQRILDNLGSGLEVGMSESVIYGQRGGGVKAFWSLSRFDGSGKPREVSKLHPEPLYQVKDFIQGIINFINGKDSPSCELFFCLGEQWPDSDKRPWQKKLIMVEVVPISMEILKNLAVESGASSLQSADLQMSLEEMMELCH